MDKLKSRELIRKKLYVKGQFVARMAMGVRGITFHFSHEINFSMPLANQIHLNSGDTLSINIDAGPDIDLRLFLLVWMYHKRLLKITAVLRLFSWQNQWSHEEPNVYQELLHVGR